MLIDQITNKLSQTAPITGFSQKSTIEVTIESHWILKFKMSVQWVCID